ncbi:hypothetical protein SAMN05660350_01166 [Geodermatophilus obscurus]|uniref:Uncharacterized protein n=1 Tax=Geodermatophilus obscurus TaxID=1861 RepID=A0A1M7SYV7_9ACTN|nr:hypothetical protein [Geodermatophilus obscurus]SHN63636.1 hypothetical protein SAMN05660350_01166 [Geodermatophilus obscurus]
MIQRLAAALLVTVLAAWLALVEVFWLPLRVFGVPVPVSVLAAVVGNLLLVALAARWTGSRLAATLPAVVWLVVAVGASLRRPEGDLLLAGSGVLGFLSLAFLLAGVVAAAFAVGQVLAAPRGGVDRQP